MAVERGMGEGGPDTREVNPDRPRTRHATLATTTVKMPRLLLPWLYHSGNAAANANVARHLRGHSQGSPGEVGHWGTT